MNYKEALAHALADNDKLRGEIAEAERRGRIAMREEAARVADNYGREGDRLSREYACEVADEIAARLRALPDDPPLTSPPREQPT